MHPSAATRRPIAGTASPAPSETHDATIRSHDRRALGLAAASRRLSASAADLDIVFVARAKSDLQWCPACPKPHPLD